MSAVVDEASSVQSGTEASGGDTAAPKVTTEKMLAFLEGKNKANASHLKPVKGLRSDNVDTTADGGEAEDTGDAVEDDAAPEAAEAREPGETEAKPEAKAEKKSHWTQEAKAEIERVTAQAAALEERDAQWQVAATRLRDEVERMEEYSRTLEERLAAAGVSVDPNETEVMRLKRELDTLKREKELEAHTRTQAEERAHKKAVEAHKAKLLTEAKSVMAKFPELDPKQNRESAEKFWRAYARTSEWDTDLTISAFAEEWAARNEWKQKLPAVKAAREHLDANRAAPRTATGKSAGPRKFNTTLEGQAAFLRSRGYVID